MSEGGWNELLAILSDMKNKNKSSGDNEIAMEAI